MPALVELVPWIAAGVLAWVVGDAAQKTGQGVQATGQGIDAASNGVFKIALVGGAIYVAMKLAK